MIARVSSQPGEESIIVGYVASPNITHSVLFSERFQVKYSAPAVLPTSSKVPASVTMAWYEYVTFASRNLPR
jgi:hypothetical protein